MDAAFGIRTGKVSDTSFVALGVPKILNPSRQSTKSIGNGAPLAEKVGR